MASLLAVCAITASFLPAAAHAQTVSSGWHVQRTPNGGPQDNQLTRVSCTNADACMAAAAPSASWASSPRSTSPTAPCVKVSAWIGPPHSHVGDTINWEVDFTNCEQHYVHIKWIILARGPCGAPLGKFNGHTSLPPGPGFGLVSIAFTACKGTYRVTAKVLRRGVRLDRASHYLHVQP